MKTLLATLTLVLDFLFKGGLKVCGIKAAGYFVVGLLFCAINERGESDGIYRAASVNAVWIGLGLAIFAIAWSLIRETREERWRRSS